MQLLTPLDTAMYGFSSIKDLTRGASGLSSCWKGWTPSSMLLSYGFFIIVILYTAIFNCKATQAELCGGGIEMV